MNRSAAVLRSSRREAVFVMSLWTLACAYTVGYAALFAYRVDPNPTLIIGMPAWVFWGVLTPWAVCTLLTCWYALFVIRDEDLGEDAAGEQGEGRGESGRDG
jgi:hypothetical protein